MNLIKEIRRIYIFWSYEIRKDYIFIWNIFSISCYCYIHISYCITRMSVCPQQSARRQVHARARGAKEIDLCEKCIMLFILWFGFPRRPAQDTKLIFLLLPVSGNKLKPRTQSWVMSHIKYPLTLVIHTTHIHTLTHSDPSKIKKKNLKNR